MRCTPGCKNVALASLMGHVCCRSAMSPCSPHALPLGLDEAHLLGECWYGALIISIIIGFSTKGSKNRVFLKTRFFMHDDWITRFLATDLQKSRIKAYRVENAAHATQKVHGQDYPFDTQPLTLAGGL